MWSFLSIHCCFSDSPPRCEWYSGPNIISISTMNGLVWWWGRELLLILEVYYYQNKSTTVWVMKWRVIKVVFGFCFCLFFYDYYDPLNGIMIHGILFSWRPKLGFFGWPVIKQFISSIPGWVFRCLCFHLITRVWGYTSLIIGYRKAYLRSYWSHHQLHSWFSWRRLSVHEESPAQYSGTINSIA